MAVRESQVQESYRVLNLFSDIKTFKQRCRHPVASFSENVVRSASGNSLEVILTFRLNPNADCASSIQICVGKQEDGEMFLKLSSGKKRGLVPADSIEEI